MLVLASLPLPMSLSICPRSQGCTAALPGFIFLVVWVSLYGLGQTNYQGHSGNSPESRFCTLWVEIGESLEKFISCKIPSGLCKHKSDGIPLVFRKICERGSASAFLDWNYYFLRSCWRAALQMSQWGVGWERLAICLVLGVDLPLKPGKRTFEIHFYACLFYIAFLSEVRSCFPALQGFAEFTSSC